MLGLAKSNVNRGMRKLECMVSSSSEIMAGRLLSSTSVSLSLLSPNTSQQTI